MPALPDGQNTLIVIAPDSGAGPLAVTEWGSRGITQTLEFIDAAKAGGVRRDINGNAIDLTYTQFQKYRTTITCTDFDLPVVDGVEVGDMVTVECAVELPYVGTPSRTVASGSTRTDTNGKTFYRPVLTMIVTDIRVSFDEWAAEYAWAIDAEEA